MIKTNFCSLGWNCWTFQNRLSFLCFIYYPGRFSMLFRHKVSHTFLWIFSILSLLKHFNWICLISYCPFVAVEHVLSVILTFDYICKCLHVCLWLDGVTRSPRSFCHSNNFFAIFSVGSVRNRPGTVTEKSPISYEINKISKKEKVLIRKVWKGIQLGYQPSWPGEKQGGLYFCAI